MTLSKEWTIISALMYGQEFIDELAEFLQQFNIEHILECGCGGGHVLEGLAERGFSGIGIDSNLEMINIAQAEHGHPAIEFARLDWRQAASIGQQFDCVMCRGNSLISAGSWESKDDFDADVYPPLIRESLRAMLAALQDGGLLYLDTVSRKEINRGGGKISLNYPKVRLKGEIIHDWDNRKRIVEGSGAVYGEYFSNKSTFYLMSPDELVEILRSLGVYEVFKPKIAAEINYDIVCAIK